MESATLILILGIIAIVLIFVIYLVPLKKFETKAILFLAIIIPSMILYISVLNTEYVLYDTTEESFVYEIKQITNDYNFIATIDDKEKRISYYDTSAEKYICDIVLDTSLDAPKYVKIVSTEKMKSKKKLFDTLYLYETTTKTRYELRVPKSIYNKIYLYIKE